MNELVKISDLTVAYGSDDPILNKVNLDIYQNDFLGIIGPNGGGKTTLLKSILGLIKPSAGRILFYNKNGQIQSKLNIGYLPQINQIDKNFPISVFDVILSGLKSTGSLFLNYTKSQKEQCLLIAEKMGVQDYIHFPIGALSGGQLQRVLLGRAIVDNPDLLVLDEPNSYVDKRFEKSFYNILGDLNLSTSIVLVSHDVGTVISLVKNIACVNRGVHYHSGRDVTSEWLEEYYSSCPIEILGHGQFPHRILGKHDECDCCNDV